MSIENLTGKDYENKIAQSKGLKVIDFSAAWCGPCQMLAPIFERIAQNYGDKADFFKVDVDEEQDLAIQFQVQGVPTLVFIKDGKEVDRNTGLIQENNLTDKIESLLN